MATILVTGGAGFIGSHTCEALLARGDKVVCVDCLDELLYSKERKLKNLALLQRPGFTFHQVDITDRPALATVFASHKIDKVIHIAALAGVGPSVKDPARYADVNIGGTLALLELCKQHDIKTFIFASSSSVYGEDSKVPYTEDARADKPTSPYAATKRAGELLCATYSHLYGIRCSCLRFFTVYGPRGRPDMATWRFTEGILKNPPITLYGDGSIKRDMTYIRDIVSGILAALDLAPLYAIFNLGDEHPISMKELITILEKATGKKAMVDQQPAKAEDLPITFANIKKAKEVLGYQPQVSIEEGVRRFVAWYKANEVR